MAPNVEVVWSSKATQLVAEWLIAHETLTPSLRIFLKAAGDNTANRNRVIRECVTIVVGPFNTSLSGRLLKDALGRVDWDQVGDVLTEALHE